jgi:hypothetical protein
MVRKMSWKSWVIVGVAVAVMAASGGLLMASNMGFKINRAITTGFVGAQAPKGHNWISLPYQHPYTTAKDLCNALGATTVAGTVTQIDPGTGIATNFTCNNGVTIPPNFTLGTISGNPNKPYLGVRFTCGGTCMGAAVNSGILVGSSNEATQIVVQDAFLGAQAPKRYNFISVPLHTTWVTANDICITLNNLTAAVTITRYNASNGVLTNHVCNQGPGGLSNFSLVIGEAVRITRAGAGVITISPPHF